MRRRRAGRAPGRLAADDVASEPARVLLFHNLVTVGVGALSAEAAESSLAAAALLVSPRGQESAGAPPDSDVGEVVLDRRDMR